MSSEMASESAATRSGSALSVGRRVGEVEDAVSGEELANSSCEGELSCDFLKTGESDAADEEHDVLLKEGLALLFASPSVFTWGDGPCGAEGGVADIQ